MEIENSDIVEKGFYFCDSFGFKKIDFEPKKDEQTIVKSQAERNEVR